MFAVSTLTLAYAVRARLVRYHVTYTEIASIAASRRASAFAAARPSVMRRTADAGSVAYRTAVRLLEWLL